MKRKYTERKSQRTGVFEEDEEGELCSMPRKAHKQYGVASGDERETIVTSITFIDWCIKNKVISPSQLINSPTEYIGWGANSNIPSKTSAPRSKNTSPQYQP